MIRIKPNSRKRNVCRETVSTNGKKGNRRKEGRKGKLKIPYTVLSNDALNI
jgi:hypothetical protein